VAKKCILRFATRSFSELPQEQSVKRAQSLGKGSIVSSIPHDEAIPCG
jgi:hypothetical protein